MIATYINNILYLIPVEDLTQCGDMFLRIKIPSKKTNIKYKAAEKYEAFNILTDFGFDINDFSNKLLSENTVSPYKKYYKYPDCGAPVWKKGQHCKKMFCETQNKPFYRKKYFKGFIKNFLMCIDRKTI